MLVVLLVIQILIAVALIAAVLVQKSEGGALGMGGGGGGLMTARGASNLLTRTTAILATLFFVNCIALTVVGNFARGGSSVVDAAAVGSIDLNRLKTAPAPAAAQQPAAPNGQGAPSLNDLAAPLPEVRQPGAAPAPAEAPASTPPAKQ
ncbi:preprotein translocase subunit SecG [Caulobacter sp. 17J65-9]|uniref:preprotein translocase subunit SecG n=1 Tax=Caulobacter sp. 17J65-9 TaxID=2709382 RepID=UPI0013C709DB|nr:preprotein translocase subunit SecG [Caulobacter sp. 17J65-9]NEX92685.1 preprotein translocase subunit SecG [Caulobacter sp. 17J65-9]